MAFDGAQQLAHGAERGVEFRGGGDGAVRFHVAAGAEKFAAGAGDDDTAQIVAVPAGGKGRAECVGGVE